jgi:Ca-activated chloride channel family protein
LRPCRPAVHWALVDDHHGTEIRRFRDEGNQGGSCFAYVCMNPTSSTQKPRFRFSKTIALLLALSLVAGACSDDSEATDGESEAADSANASSSGDPATGFDLDSSADPQSGSLDESSADETAADDAVSSGESENAVGEAAQAVEEDVARADESGRDAGGSGFFDEDRSDAGQLEDNTFENYGVRSFIETSIDPLSTFALDVDTASYSVGRQWLTEGVLPPLDSVRVEEYVNSFDYDYPAPAEGLTVVADGGPSPFNTGNVILRLGVQGEIVAEEDRPTAALTFVIDTSGSMDRQNRLELVKASLLTLLSELDRDDSVAIVTYSGGANVLLPPTSLRNRDEIAEVIESLETDGSTNLEAGLRAGYDLANESFRDDGINRVILASDGVANVGLTDPDGLVRLIRSDADRGIQLVTVGVGMGNFNDVVMETLADDGDGFYAYVDTQDEAEKLFSDDLVGTLLTVAIDGKIQVEFDDETVETYRLLGFENRAVLDQDFRNDAVDAGELGSGHQVTAVYELTLRRGVGDRDRLGTASLRWEDPEEGSVRETRLELTAGTVSTGWGDADEDFRLAVTVAAFAEILRGSQYAMEIDLDQVVSEAEALEHRGSDVRELTGLVREAVRLS